jgi:hypothetical protein
MKKKYICMYFINIHIIMNTTIIYYRHNNTSLLIPLLVLVLCLILSICFNICKVCKCKKKRNNVNKKVVPKIAV